MPSSYFNFLNFGEKNIIINMFIGNQYIKHFYLIPLNLRVSSVVSPHSFNRSSYPRTISPGMILVALLCILSSICMYFLRYGLHAWIPYCKWGLIIALYIAKISNAWILHLLVKGRLLIIYIILSCYNIFFPRIHFKFVALDTREPSWQDAPCSQRYRYDTTRESCCYI